MKKIFKLFLKTLAITLLGIIILGTAGIALAETTIPGFNDVIDAILDALRVYYEGGGGDTVALQITIDSIIDVFKLILP